MCPRGCTSSGQHAAKLLELCYGSRDALMQHSSIVHAGILASLVVILSVIIAYQEKLQQFMAEIGGDDTAAGSRLRKAD